MSEANVSTAVSVLTSNTRMRHRQHAQHAREHQRGARRHLARGQRPALGARHLRVDALVEHVIDDRGAGGRESDSEVAEHQRIERRQAGHRQQRAHDGREHDEHDDARLGQLVEAAPARVVAAATMGSGVAKTGAFRRGAKFSRIGQ